MGIVAYLGGLAFTYRWVAAEWHEWEKKRLTRLN